MTTARIICLVLLGLGLGSVRGELNDPELYVADYYPQPQPDTPSAPGRPYHYRYRYRNHYQVPQIDEDDYMPPDEPGYFVDYPLPTQYNNRALEKNVLEFLEKNGLQKEDPSDLLNKRVLTSFRERKEREKSKEQQDKLAELFLQKLQEEADDKELEREYDNRDYIEMIEGLWEKYKNSQYDKDAPVFVGEMNKRQFNIPVDYSALGWSGVGLRKRAPSAYDVFDVDIDRDDDNDNVNDNSRQQMRYHFVKPQTPEMYSSYPAEFLYAKRKRFPVAKRSSNFYAFSSQGHHKRGVNNNQNKKILVGASGTDPKVVQDLSNIFGNKEAIKQNMTKPGTNLAPKKVVNENKKPGNKKMISPVAVTVSPVKESSATSTTDSAHAQSHSHSHNHKQAEQVVHSGNGLIKDEPLNIQKKSIDWSNYFGIDRRKKKSFTNDNEIDNDWLIKKYNTAVAMAVKRSSEYPLNIFRNHHKKESDGPLPEEENRKPQRSDDTKTKLRDMDDKLKNIEDLIIDEALKYTGAHEGETDPAEIQEVKDKVISRLAAAYSLEKMRRALSEFKSSLAAQKYEGQRNGNENQAEPASTTDTQLQTEPESGRDEAMKKKSKEPEKKCASKSGCQEDSVASNEIDAAIGVGAERCNIIENRCQRLMKGGYSDLFFSLCKWHQLCYLCQDDVDMGTCDMMFLSRADALCRADVVCQWAARPALTYLRQLQDPSPQCDRAAICSR